MPIITIHSPGQAPDGLLARLCERVSSTMRIPSDRAWAFWNRVEPGSHHRPDWATPVSNPGPMVLIVCQEKHAHEAVRGMMSVVREELARELGCAAESVFVAVQRVASSEVLELPRTEAPAEAKRTEDAVQEITMRPIGFVRSPRKEITDDYWGGVLSTIEIDARQFDAEVLAGLEDYSHIEVIFHFHRVAPEKIVTEARHPRNRTDLPKVGIFAQRAKGRPNRVGLTRCELLWVDGLKLGVRGLDAIDGTPVVDIKPYMTEFAPRGELRQPKWTPEIMSHYFDIEKS